MEQTSSSEANIRLYNQRLPIFCGDPEVHYRVHKRPPLVLILSQVNLQSTVSSCIF